MDDYLINLSEKKELPLTRQNKTLFTNPAIKRMIHDDQLQSNIHTQKVLESIVKNTKGESVIQKKLYEHKRKIQTICRKNVELSQQVEALKKALCRNRRNGIIISLSIGVGMFLLGSAFGRAESRLSCLKNKG